MIPLWDAYVEDEHVVLKTPLPMMVRKLVSTGVRGPSRGHAYKKRGDVFKISTNVRLAQLAARAASKCLVDDPTPTAALYLDSGEGSTTRALKLHANYSDAHLCTPNDDPSVCADIKAKFPSVQKTASSHPRSRCLHHFVAWPNREPGRGGQA
jgi:hypothetical protein